MTFEQIIERFQARKNGPRWMARCPSHEDRKPSLSISEGEQSILLHCHAGCSVESICAALDIKVSDLSGCSADCG
jgi:putative DNA primase/helicase